MSIIRKIILYNARKITIMIFSLILIGIITMGSTYAYYHKETKELTNKFTVGKITTEIKETDFDKIGNKTPKVVNKDVTDCIVRMRYDISPNNPDEELIKLNLEASTLWEKSNDGFYYYKEVLDGKKDNLEDETEPLFTTYELTEKGKSFFADNEFQIILYQEAVQTKVVNDSGEILTPFDNNGFSIVKAKAMFDYYNNR